MMDEMCLRGSISCSSRGVVDFLFILLRLLPIIEQTSMLHRSFYPTFLNKKFLVKNWRFQIIRSFPFYDKNVYLL